MRDPVFRMRTMSEESHLISASEVARRLRLSVERVRQLSRSGRLPPDLTIGKTRYWLPETVERFAATRDPWGRFSKEPPKGSGEGS